MESREKHIQKDALTEHESFSQKKNEGWNTPVEIFQSQVEDATGSSIVEKTRIVNGETNEVYAVTTESGKEVIVRIHHGESNRFKKERWALEECSKIPVPTPKMLSVGR